ncbi:Rha family transcriptional regulator [Desulfobacula sp.]|uniref:Rha family transcriptional regulator n=1 Tax=Desulfobacula sp. TaxID=2593537 RepID=UPI003443D5C1
MTDTRTLENTFGKQHKNVIQKLESLDCSEEFAALNFQEGSYPDRNGQFRPMYKMTRDGWAFLSGKMKLKQ